MVITSCLLNRVTLEAISSIRAEICAERFLKSHYKFHWLPTSTTSDYGSNSVGDLRQKLYSITRARQRLSTNFDLEPGKNT